MAVARHAPPALTEVAQGSADTLERSENRIPERAINRQAGLALMWIGRCAALPIAIFALGIWLFGKDGWWGERSFSGVGEGEWRWLAILLALWVVALAFTVQS